jgi:membrane protease YdiL (CAAX protease family)
MNATTGLAAAIAVAWSLLVATSPRGFFLLAVPVCAVWLALSARAAGPGLPQRLRPRAGDLAAALAVAAALYAGTRVFLWAGCGGLTGALCEPVRSLLGRFEARAPGPALILAFLVAPAEELFWRGVVQERLVRRLGAVRGVAAATAIAAAVALATGEPLLALAIVPTYAAWGALAAWRGSLAAPIVSHAAWTLAIVAWGPAFR